MFGLPYSLIIKLAISAIIAGIIGFHFVGDSRLKSNLEETKLELIQTQNRYNDLETKFLAVTTASKVYAEKAIKADEAREVIANDLKSALAKLQGQKPPPQCKEAILWSIQNKQDLKW